MDGHNQWQLLDEAWPPSNRYRNHEYGKVIESRQRHRTLVFVLGILYSIEK